MTAKPMPGVFQVMQIGNNNTAIFGDAIIKIPVFPTMEETFQALMSTPMMKAIFPNVPDASMFFGQMMEKSLEEMTDGGPGKILKTIIDSKTNLLDYGQHGIPGGVGVAITGGGKGRG